MNKVYVVCNRRTNRYTGLWMPPSILGVFNGLYDAERAFRAMLECDGSEYVLVELEIDAHGQIVTQKILQSESVELVFSIHNIT